MSSPSPCLHVHMSVAFWLLRARRGSEVYPSCVAAAQPQQQPCACAAPPTTTPLGSPVRCYCFSRLQKSDAAAEETGPVQLPRDFHRSVESQTNTPPWL
ncbi:hypothetical protein EDB80DRAFT_696992 [Ilyonectria destructans]|nr:hypothetical protein EDB80DRAFT_696992 [Ilyonectria destructans]